MDLKESDILGDDVWRHWYYRSKSRAMFRLMGKSMQGSVLDVGAGSGFFSKQLLLKTNAESACLVDSSYGVNEETVFAGKPVKIRKKISRSSADLVLMMDVLEHVEDDVGLLQSYVEIVPDNCRFLVSVPAFEALWSSHDVFLEHQRRYSLRQLERVIRSAGLLPIRRCYFFGLALPIAVAVRLGERLHNESREVRSHLRQHSPAVNTLLTAICALETPFMRMNRVAGLTAFCLAIKP